MSGGLPPTGWRPTTSPRPTTNPPTTSSPGSRGFNPTVPGGTRPSSGMVDGMRQIRPGIYTTRPSRASGTIFMGLTGAVGGRSSIRPLVVDKDIALNYFGQLPKPFQNALTEASKSIGGRTGNSMWTKMVEEAERRSNSSGRLVSPIQVFQELYPNYALNVGFFKTEPGASPAAFLLGEAGQFASESAGGGGGGYGYGGGGTSQTVDIYSPEAARGLLMQAMQGALGRDPSADEISTFTKALNEAQKASPVTVTSSGTTTTRTGGMEADLFALDWARANEEYQAVQGTNYYRALIGALTGG